MIKCRMRRATEIARLTPRIFESEQISATVCGDPTAHVIRPSLDLKRQAKAELVVRVRFDGSVLAKAMHKLVPRRMALT